MTMSELLVPTASDGATFFFVQEHSNEQKNDQLKYLDISAKGTKENLMS